MVLIIGVLAAIAIPSFLGQQQKAFDAGAKELAHAAELATETYATDHAGSYYGVTLAKLDQIDPTINTTKARGAPTSSPSPTRARPATRSAPSRPTTRTASP